MDLHEDDPGHDAREAQRNGGNDADEEGERAQYHGGALLEPARAPVAHHWRRLLRLLLLLLHGQRLVEVEWSRVDHHSLKKN